MRNSAGSFFLQMKFLCSREKGNNIFADRPVRMGCRINATFPLVGPGLIGLVPAVRTCLDIYSNTKCTGSCFNIYSPKPKTGKA